MIGKWKLNKYGVWVPADPTLFIKVTSDNFKEILSFIRNGDNLYGYSTSPRTVALSLQDGTWTHHDGCKYYPDNNFEDFKKKSLLIKELAEKYPVGTKVKTACKTSTDNFVYTITAHDFTIGSNNNIYVSTVEGSSGVALWMNNNYAEIIKDTKNEIMEEVKSTDPFFDDALKAAKKVWPEFEWGCQMANRAGKTFAAIKPEEFNEHRRITWGKFIAGTYDTCIIDPKNTHHLNYKPSDLTVVSTKSAKERAEKLMSSLPKSAAVKDQDIPEDVKKKLAERDKKEEFKSPKPNCQKYKVGDIVLYLGKDCKIVNYSSEGSYILEYSHGWEGDKTKLLLPGTLDPTKKYHFANDSNIAGYALTQPAPPIIPPPLPSQPVPDFKVGDWVTITRSDHDWADLMYDYIGRTVQIKEFNLGARKNGYTVIHFQDDGMWKWCYEDGHFRAATAAEIRALDGSSLAYKDCLTGLNGFRVGGQARVVRSGRGMATHETGAVVTITELSPNSYNRGPAARIAEPLGNQRSGAYDRWIGLESFEPIDLYQRPDDFFREMDYLKKSIKKDSSLIELKQEPHTITESLAEPMLLRYNKSKSKLISI